MEIMVSDQVFPESVSLIVPTQLATRLQSLAPGATKPWMIEFGGHHLGLNFVVAGANGFTTPTLAGA
jgi:hypothetical protein